MNCLKSIIHIVFIASMMALSACVDDGPGRYVSSDGEVVVSLEAVFSPFAAGDLTRVSNVDPARGFNSISDIAILVFDSEGNLLPQYLKEVVNPQTSDEDRVDGDAAYGHSAESDTKKVEDIPLLLPVGAYYVIGVANFGSYESNESGDISIKEDASGKLLTSLERIRQEIEKSKATSEHFTLDMLRALKVDWDAADYANDRAMLGFFSSSDSPKPHAESMFETLVVSRSAARPRAWLRRCASKITVDFDGTGLREGVSIFIKDVRIYDIAKQCTLGFGNPDSDDEGMPDFNNHPSLIADLIQCPGEESGSVRYIEFGEGDKYDDWPRISRQTPYILDSDGKTRKNLHTQDSESLYFYENMQGTRDGYDRSPKPNLVEGGLAEGYNEKDGVACGTYIEVSAVHVVEEDGESKSQEMKYRFVIGKNSTDNFDAERNHHYKLTLAFIGSADEYHWHIDYTREEGFKVPNPWYVSYVYNHDAYLPFEFNLSDDWEIADLVAEIETNPWYPTTSSDYNEGHDSDLTDPDYEIKPQVPDGDEPYPYENPTNIDNKRNSNGFLSLRVPTDETVLTDKMVGFTFSGYNDELITEPEKYYNGEQAGTDAEGHPLPKVNHGMRKIIENAATVIDNLDTREELSVKRDNGVYSIGIPLFTREKALVKETGYSGNNPFVGYQRVAKVKLTAQVRKKDDHSLTKEYVAKVNVVQVRRVVNPKGVYRKAGNNEPFHVNLKFLTSERADGEFRSIVSRGPWMAEVLGDANFITLDGRQRITGSSRDQIDFTIRFNRMGGAGNKNAIVRIKYHNYTCTHLIFVRQGYDPQAICGGGPVYNNSSAPATEWHTFNMLAGDVMADDPRDEGSMFKFGNSHNAISSINNIYKDASGNPIYYEQSRDGFVPQATLTIIKADGSVNEENNLWTKVGHFDDGFTHWPTLKIAHAATIRDFEQLYLTKHVEFGYGVLYADGATETQSTLEMVNGWSRYDESADKDKKGMRGVFAYYWNPNEASEYNTRNIFFPIGRSGYGHRKEGKDGKEAPENSGKGILRYSCNRYLPSFYTSPNLEFKRRAPLLEFIYRRMGAIYWARTKTSPGQYLTSNGLPPTGGDANGCAMGLDLNYYNFDVNAIADAPVADGADACFVRTVEHSAGD